MISIPKRLNTKVLLVLLIGGLIAAFFALDAGRFFTLEYVQSQRENFFNYYAQHQLLTIGLYFVIYVCVTALSLPGAAIMTLLGGGIFGLLIGTVVVSFASTIGATLAFLVSRFLLRDYVQRKFGGKLQAINRGIEREGAFYLFTLRLIPIFPFFVINLVMGLTPLKTWQFFFVSQIGMLAGTIVYVNAGSQLASIESPGDILSPTLLLSFALLGVFPLVAKKLVEWIKARKSQNQDNEVMRLHTKSGGEATMKDFKKPRHFDYNLAVIGAGSAGLVTAYIAAAIKAKVALIEKHKMGGDCLNTGCVPSKALIRSAKILSYAHRARDFGFDNATVDFDFAAVMERVQAVIRKVEPHDSVQRYTGLGVDCYQGEARLVSPYEVHVNGKTITAKNIVLATGARPFVPPIEGVDQVDYLTSDTVWQLRERPQKLLVLGGGPIGSELAQAFHRLGSEVTIVDRSASVLSREDDDISRWVMQRFTDEGIKVLANHQADKFVVNGAQKSLLCKHKHSGEHTAVDFDKVLIALGRRANVTGFGLEALGVQLTKTGTLAVDPFLRTNYKNIFACGDVAGPYQFTHTASHQAWYAAVNALFRPFKKFKVNYSAIPWATFTDPEVARVGLSEKDAQQHNIPYEVTTYGIDDLDRAIADSEDHGVIKVLTVPGKDKILGATIVGTHASDYIAEYVLAMTHGIGLNKILSTIHIYPTLAEANKYVAGNWKKAHKPEKLLQWVERFHAWRR